MSPWCLLASSAQQDSSLSAASAQNIKAAFRELRKSESLIEGLRTKLQAQLPDPLPLQVERTEFLPHLHAQEISRTIMLHHREPGDPAIRNLGGVIAQVPPELVTSVIRGGCQAILCHQQGRLVGLALFLPPGKLTGSFEDLDAHYPNTRNAALVQVLVAPAAQGTGVFETVMNATLLALQSTGAEMVLGEVEHTNDRAKGAYRKFLGVIDDSFSTARTFPSGKGTKWNALIIPMPGHQTESHRHNRMFGQA
jgi:ribosomal protein S18 acetylase RimI-like enzyme